MKIFLIVDIISRRHTPLLSNLEENNVAGGRKLKNPLDVKINFFFDNY